MLCDLPHMRALVEIARKSAGQVAVKNITNYPEVVSRKIGTDKSVSVYKSSPLDVKPATERSDFPELSTGKLFGRVADYTDM